MQYMPQPVPKKLTSVSPRWGRGTSAPPPPGRQTCADNFRPHDLSVSFSIQLFETTTNSDHFYRTLHLKIAMATI